MKIKQWLKVLGNNIVQQYAPLDPEAFLDSIRCLYNKKTQLENEQLKMLAQNPDLCSFIKNSSNPLLNKCTVILHTVLGNSYNYSQALENKDFISIVLKIYDINKEILLHLQSSPEKHKAALKKSAKYQKTCFDALITFYNQNEFNQASREALLEKFEKAENSYSKILSKDRTTASKAARYLLKTITNLIAALTLGLAHYVHYKKTGAPAFFSRTTSEDKLKRVHSELKEEIEHWPLGKTP